MWKYVLLMGSGAGMVFAILVLTETAFQGQEGPAAVQKPPEIPAVQKGLVTGVLEEIAAVLKEAHRDLSKKIKGLEDRRLRFLLANPEGYGLDLRRSLRRLQEESGLDFLVGISKNRLHHAARIVLPTENLWARSRTEENVDTRELIESLATPVLRLLKLPRRKKDSENTKPSSARPSQASPLDGIPFASIPSRLFPETHPSRSPDVDPSSSVLTLIHVEPVGDRAALLGGYHLSSLETAVRESLEKEISRDSAGRHSRATPCPKKPPGLLAFLRVCEWVLPFWGGGRSATPMGELSGGLESFHRPDQPQFQ